MIRHTGLGKNVPGMFECNMRLAIEAAAMLSRVKQQTVLHLGVRKSALKCMCCGEKPAI